MNGKQKLTNAIYSIPEWYGGVYKYKCALCMYPKPKADKIDVTIFQL